MDVKKILVGLCAAALLGITPASAQVLDLRPESRHFGPGPGPEWRRPGPGPDRVVRPGPRPGPGHIVRPAPRPGWYNGHRGYRYSRPGYRYYDGWWYPSAAFALGAIVGGAVSGDRGMRVIEIDDAHVEWCYNRYRSYRERDNTFQPYNGPRRQCISPYS